jgi:hypothetical protein
MTPWRRPGARFDLSWSSGWSPKVLRNSSPNGGTQCRGRFSRHASAHTVNPGQYRLENSLSALMLVAAFLREIDLLLRDNEVES